MATSILARMAVLISADSAQLQRGLKQANTSLSGFERATKGIASSLKGALGALSFAYVAKQVIDVTSNFERFEAVLTNTLGSSSSAQKALKQIKDFAASTPFSVQELTGAFVKLANQGFKPSVDELRRLGDLAASTGKGFDQLAEAIIDAQTGEFERLKEFGIRASKSGDQVRFTFKGIETQTKFTGEEIRKYILSLGDLNGVQGATAAIAETLGGQINNLGDSWDSFLLVLGKSTKGPLVAAIESLSQLLKVSSNLNAELELRGASYGFTSLKNLSKATQEYALATARLNGGKLVSEIIAPFEKLSNKEFLGNAEANLKKFVDTLVKEGATVEEAVFLWNAYLNKRAEVIKGDKEAAKEGRIKAVDDAKQQAQAHLDYLNSRGLIQGIEDDLKAAEAAKKAAFSRDEIQKFNLEIDLLKQKLEDLNTPVRGFKTDFAKKQLENAKNKLPTDLTGPQFQQVAAPELGDIFKTETAVIEPTVNLEPLFESLLTMVATTRNAYTGLDEINEDYKNKVIGHFDAIDQRAGESAEQRIARNQAIKDKEEELANTYKYVGQVFGDEVGQVISGQKTLVQGIISATLKLLPVLLASSNAGIIESAALSGGPPPVAIALAAAGVAAITALFSSATGFSGRGGGAASARKVSNVSRSPTASFGESLAFDAKFRIEGPDLVAVVDTQAHKNNRLG